MVSFNFHVDEHGDGSHHDKDQMDYVTKEHTDKVEELVSKLEGKASDILDQQQYAMVREAVHRETAESTNARVMWWTFAEVAVLIGLAFFQVSYLRNHFEHKQVARDISEFSSGCLHQLELALHYDAPSLVALQQTAPSLRTALQAGLLEVFCRLVRQPIPGHNLTGAIWKLAALAPKRDERACRVLCARLHHRRCGVREAAVCALGHVGGGLDVLPRMKDCLNDSQGRVRAAAARTLSSLAPKNDLSIIRALIVLLGDDCPDACHAAVTCISQLVEPGNVIVTQELSSLLSHPHPTTRLAALKTLALTSCRGDEVAVAVLVPCLEDIDLDIRCAAVDALRRVALHGDPVTVRGALQRLEHRDGHVRAAALRTLSWVARVGDVEVMAKAKVCLDDGVSNVRAAAVATLAELVPHKGDEEVVASVVSRLGDCEALVRTAAKESLAKVAQEGDLTAMPAILELLEHQDGRIRLAAVEALGQVAPKNDAVIISTVASLMEDRHTGVCCSAVQVLGHLGANDDACRRAIRARRDDLSGAPAPVRAAAAFVLQEECGAGTGGATSLGTSQAKHARKGIEKLNQNENLSGLLLPGAPFASNLGSI
eukprot:symbB.v1.2.006382.t1/scaffold358.1/size381540/5